MKKSEPELPIESPIPFRTGSNGEFAPRPITARDRSAEALFQVESATRARRLSMSRRDFVESAAGTALALSVINTVYGCSENTGGSDRGGTQDKGGGGGDGGTEDGSGGADFGPDSGFADSGSPEDAGRYDVDAEMTEDTGAACERLSGSEFIFDVQTHHVNPSGAWRTNNVGWAFFLRTLPQGGCGDTDPVDCFSIGNYLREMFINSDTSMAIISAVPASAGSNPLEVEDAAETRSILRRISGSERLLLHSLVQPERGQAELDGMQRLSEDLQISAWKVYTQFGGWRLDDPAIGFPFIEKARSLGIKRICAHKGLALAAGDPTFGSPIDIGPAAAAFPDVQFVVYHSGYETSVTEGPYNETTPTGVDRLIKSLRDAAIGPGGNVYAELGSTWRNVMTRPAEAAHLIGKLLKYVGEDRILWGTDSIWYGSPQDQINAFRTFEIGQMLQDQQQYPALTPAIRAKIFGLNAASLYGVDPLAVRCAIQEDDLTGLSRALPKRSPTYRHYGPRDRREFLAFMRARDGAPG